MFHGVDKPMAISVRGGGINHYGFEYCVFE
jgi:hypothetical protein